MSRYKHLKRGTFYTLISILELEEEYQEGDEIYFTAHGQMYSAEVQASKGPLTGKVAFYVSDENWFYARNANEFFDGRFVEC